MSIPNLSTIRPTSEESFLIQPTYDFFFQIILMKFQIQLIFVSDNRNTPWNGRWLFVSNAGYRLYARNSREEIANLFGC